MRTFLKTLWRTLRHPRKYVPLVVAALQLLQEATDALQDGHLTNAERGRLMKQFWRVVDEAGKVS